MRVRRGFFGDTRGAVAMEFALIGLPFVMLIIGLVEFGRGLNLRSALDDAADRAQRMILIDGAVSEDALETEIRDGFLGGVPSAIVVSHSAETTGAGDYRIVALTYDMRIIIPNPASPTITISATRKVFLN